METKKQNYAVPIFMMISWSLLAMGNPTIGGLVENGIVLLRHAIVVSILLLVLVQS